MLPYGQDMIRCYGYVYRLYNVHLQGIVGKFKAALDI